MTPNLRTIAELISLTVAPEERQRRKPVVTPLAAPLCLPDTAKLPRKFECEVFNFLLGNRDALGVETVFRFKNLFVDGAILLTDGRRLAVEVKLCMNWTKALQAESEFRRFLLTPEANANPVSGVVVFFEAFQGDGWHRRAKSRLLENGWNHWYANYARIDGHRADLFRLSQGAFEYYGQALANSVVASVGQLSEQEREKLLAAATPSVIRTPAVSDPPAGEA
jgi:hypothetical protein